MRFARISTALVLLFGPPAFAAEEPDPTKTNYLVFPAKSPDELTELQRTLEHRGKPVPNYRVIINASPAVRADRTIDLTDWTSLEKAIHERVRVKVGNQKYRIAITVAFYGRCPADADRHFLYWAMKGMAMDFGYDEIVVGGSINTDPDAWANDIKMKRAYDQIGKGQDKEPAVGDGLVSVYPVRTPYSRHVLRGADCVVDIKRPFDRDDDGTLSKDQETAIVKAIEQLKLPSKGVICFRITGKFGASQAIRTFSNETGSQLAKKLGFKSHSTHELAAE
jgi:hypothetical protein